MPMIYRIVYFILNIMQIIYAPYSVQTGNSYIYTTTYSRISRDAVRPASVNHLLSCHHVCSMCDSVCVVYHDNCAMEDGQVA